MPGFARRPLAVFVGCLFAGTQISHGAVETARAAAARSGDPEPMAPRIVVDFPGEQAGEVNLRLEKKFFILAAKKAPPDPKSKGYAPIPVPGLKLDEGEKKQVSEDRPTFITADRIEGRTDDFTEAEGNVELRKVDTLVLADKLNYSSLRDEVEAEGNVLYRQGEDQISGPHMRMKLSEQIGFFDQAEYHFRREVDIEQNRKIKPVRTTISNTTTSGAPLMINVASTYGLQEALPPRRTSDAHGRAEKIDFEGENQVRLSDATFSTCKPGETDWYLKGREFRLDYDKDEGQASDATVVFKDTPIFYLPSGSFSLNNQRKSGFLTGSFAASSKNGIDVTLPYYVNLAPNYDVTLYPRHMSKRGSQLGVEARYLDHYSQSDAKLEVLPDDQMDSRERHAYKIVHTQNLGQGFHLNLNLNGVSDDSYWQDLSSHLLHTSQQQLPRQVGLTYAPGSWWTGSIQVLSYQTLNPDPSRIVARPYFLEPQIGFSGRLADVRNMDISVFSQFARFTHPSKVDGNRLVAYPQISIPIVDPAYLIIPKFGLHATHYALENQAAGVPASQGRVLPTFTLDGSLVFERQTSWLGRDHIQTPEPRLYYVYIPYRNQDRIPVFDSAIADFNFAQIFTENRYTGFDRINDANQLTTALTTRYLDATTGAERFKAMVGQRYYFDAQRITIPGETERQRSFSNFLAAFNGLVAPSTYVDAAWEYDYHRNQNQRFSLGGRYQPEVAKVLSAGYRTTRDALGVSQIKQIDIAGQWPLDARWYAVGRYNYSLRDKQALETIAGVEYNAGCWAARFVVQRLEAVAGSPNTTVFFQLELNDFASVGSNPIGLLRRTVPGYSKSNELPTSSHFLTD